MSEPTTTNETLSRIAGASGARLVVLFGSVARGEASPDSDVDIGVSGLGFWDGLRLGHALGGELGRDPHVVDLDTAPELLRIEVAREGLVLHEGERDAWVRYRADAIVRWLDFEPFVRLCAEGVRQRLLREARRG